MEGFVDLIVTGAAGALLLGGVLVQRFVAETQRAVPIWQRAWQEAAEELDGELLDGGPRRASSWRRWWVRPRVRINLASRARRRRARRSWIPRRRRAAVWRIACEVGDAIVRLSARADKVYAIEARAAYPVPAGPALRVYVEGIGASVRKEHGSLRDLELGHRLFDERFVVEGAGAEAAAEVWDKELLDAVYRHLPEITLSSDEEQVTLTCPVDLVPEPAVARAQLVSAARLVGGLAGADLFGLGALRRLGGTFHAAGEGTPPRVVLDGPRPVTLGPVVEDRRALTRASVAQLAADAEGWEVDLSRGGKLPEALRTGASEAPLAQLGGGKLSGDGRELVYRFDGIERDRSRLQAAVDLLQALSAVPGAGAYR